MVVGEKGSRDSGRNGRKEQMEGKGTGQGEWEGEGEVSETVLDREEFKPKAGFQVIVFRRLVYVGAARFEF